MDKVSTIPKNEIVWVSHYDCKGNLQFLITSSANREHYYVYRVEKDGGFARLGSSQSPLQLEQKYVK